METKVVVGIFQRIFDIKLNSHCKIIGIWK